MTDEADPGETAETAETAQVVLALIPASLLAATAAAAALPLSLGTALAVGCLPATGSIGYALFYDPPVAAE